MNKTNKMKLQFFLGSVFLVAAVAISLANDFASKIEKIFAHQEDGIADSTSNNFSEVWTATEITGDAAGFDDVVGGGSALDFVRLYETTSASSIVSPNEPITFINWYFKGAVGELIQRGNALGYIVGTPTTDEMGVKHINWGTHGSLDTGRLLTGNEFQVTKWVINGHLHP